MQSYLLRETLRDRATRLSEERGILGDGEHVLALSFT